MEIRSDIALKGDAWAKAIDEGTIEDSRGGRRGEQEHTEEYGREPRC